MNQQVLIAISREAGSGGQDIAIALAERFHLPLYDKRILDHIAAEHNADPETLKRYDEIPRFRGVSRTVKGYNNSPHEQVARMQFDFLTQRARAGESFIVLGRCGDEILHEYKNLISIFILADILFKKNRIMNHEGINEATTLERMARIDRLRKYYHNQYSRGRWGDAKNYDLCIDSGKLGIEKTIDVLEQYIRIRIANFNV
ncbi:MAG: AAA family ATPase [Eubacteriales bacterium]